MKERKPGVMKTLRHVLGVCVALSPVLALFVALFIAAGWGAILNTIFLGLLFVAWIKLSFWLLSDWEKEKE